MKNEKTGNQGLVLYLISLAAAFVALCFGINLGAGEIDLNRKTNSIVLFIILCLIAGVIIFVILFPKSILIALFALAILFTALGFFLRERKNK